MRHDFTKTTKRLLAALAGNTCSYFNCVKRTGGPDVLAEGGFQAGIAAHIYSASPGGPRGQGGLSRQELMHDQNGIWLCLQHAALIDANNGVGHPAAKLFSYKRLHEHRVQKEMLGVCSTIGWLDEFEIVKSPLFAPGAKVRLGKLNLLFGNNSLGKTTLGRYLGGVFQVDHLDYWYDPGEIDLEFRLNYYNPDPMTIKFAVSEANPARYEINGNASSANPLKCHVIIVPEFDVRTEGNDRRFIAGILKLPEWEIEELVESINTFPDSNLRNYHFVDDEEDGGSTLHLEVRKEDYPKRIFGVLSSTEQKWALMDFATAAARKASKLVPTLLVLDCNFMGDSEHFKQFEPQLLAPENQFQTIMTMRIEGIDLADVKWAGWEVIWLYREGNSLTQFSQDPKLKIVPTPWPERLSNRSKKRKLLF